MKERPVSKHQVMVGKTAFGGDKLVACVPVVSTSREVLLEDLRQICPLKPDLIEWRIDYFTPLDDRGFLTDTLRMAAEITRDIPILLTFRALSEGGFRDYPDRIREDVICTLCDTGLIQAVDIELAGEAAFVDRVRTYVKSKGIKLILSWHNIHETPELDFMVNCLLEEERSGADIAKLSVQPRSFHDVVTLLKAAHLARQQLSIPQITVSKDDIGVITRIFGYYLGSDLTFFSVAGSSTIGQVSLEDYRELQRLFQLD